MTRTVRTLILEDDRDIRDLIEFVFELAADVEIVGLAGDIEEAAALFSAVRPDAVIVDHQLGAGNGFDFARWVLAQDPDTCVLLYTGLVDDTLVDRAANAGIRECVAKERYSELPALVIQHSR